MRTLQDRIYRRTLDVIVRTTAAGNNVSERVTILRRTRLPRAWKKQDEQFQKTDKWDQLATIAGGRNENEGAKRSLGKKRVGFLAIYFAGGRAKKKGNASFYSEDRRLNFWVERKR